MAKIGNEAKLILKLAEERFTAAVKRHEDEAILADSNDNKLSTSHRNKAAGLGEGMAILNSIYLEILEN